MTRACHLLVGYLSVSVVTAYCATPNETDSWRNAGRTDQPRFVHERTHQLSQTKCRARLTFWPPSQATERCSQKRGARPCRSLFLASRRTARAVDSIHHLVHQCECCRPVGGTPTGAVETTALPISQLRTIFR